MKFMKIYSFLLFFVAVGFAQAQEEKLVNENKPFSVGLHYVANLNNENLLSENYNGIAGLDAKYVFASTDVVKFDGGFSFDYLNGSKKGQYGLTYNAMTVINPKIGIEVAVFKSGFKPFVSLGYAFVNYSYTIKFNSLQNYDPMFISANSEKKIKYNESSFSLQPGFRYYFKKLIYLETSYKYLPIDNTINMHFFNIGLGVQF